MRPQPSHLSLRAPGTSLRKHTLNIRAGYRKRARRAELRLWAAPPRVVRPSLAPKAVPSHPLGNGVSF